MYLMFLPTLRRTAGVRIDSPPNNLRPQLNYHRCMDLDADKVLEELYRSDWGRIVASLIQVVGDFELAEEAAQEAFAAAVDQWRGAGVPHLPPPFVIQNPQPKALQQIPRPTHFNKKLKFIASY